MCVLLWESDSREMFLACTIGIPVIRVEPSNTLAGVWRGSEWIVGNPSNKSRHRSSRLDRGLRNGLGIYNSMCGSMKLPFAWRSVTGTIG
jgi:hypothetical protein